MHFCRAAVIAALFLVIQAFSAAAQDVSLRSQDGTIELNGTLLGFDGEFYRVDTIYGELTLDSSGVDCTGPGCPNLMNYVVDLSVSGSATIGEVLLPALIEAFAARNDLSTERVSRDQTHFEYRLTNRETKALVARFNFRITNSDEGFADLLANEADLVMSLREIRPAEARLAKEAGLGDLTLANRSRVLALDALVPIVTSSNSINQISLKNLSKILSGTIQNWSQLAGPDAPITIHLKDVQSGLVQSVEDRLLRPASLKLSGDIRYHDSNDALAAAVLKDPFGLGITSYSEVGHAKPLVLTGTCGFSLRGTRRTIKTEDYPLTAPMFLYLPARRLPKLVREFLAFSRSSAAQIVIRRAGFVDQAPEEIPIDLQGERFANGIQVAEGEEGLAQLKRMADILAPMKRLTTSFRFETGSIRLDAQSRSNVLQLARALEAGQLDERQLAFIGFSDGQGPAAGNLAIAKRRAEAVRQAVLNAAETANLDRLNLEVEAFGEALPMACDDSVWGRQVNRRVEVWLR